MEGNDFVKFILRSPLHRLMSGSALLITVKGRKTGRWITLPVNYVREGNSLWVISKRDRTWWRNLLGRAPVKVRLKGRDLDAFAEAILDKELVLVDLGNYLRLFPVSARAIGVRLENGKPNLDDLAEAASERLMVQITLA